jgi:hypothetical protein
VALQSDQVSEAIEGIHLQGLGTILWMNILMITGNNQGHTGQKPNQCTGSTEPQFSQLELESNGLLSANFNFVSDIGEGNETSYGYDMKDIEIDDEEDKEDENEVDKEDEEGDENDENEFRNEEQSLSVMLDELLTMEDDEDGEENGTLMHNV